MNIRQDLQHKLASSIQELGITVAPTDVPLERPGQTTHGEYASTIALIIFNREKKENPAFPYTNPRELAEKISTKLNEEIADKSSSQSIKSISVAGPGFINFTLSDSYYVQLAKSLSSSLESVYKPSKTANSIIIEYVSPNTNKPLHIGHVRNAALGSTMGRILQLTGQQVHMAIEYNDRGLHITKSMWAFLLLGKKNQPQQAQAQPLSNWQVELDDWIKHPQNWFQPSDMEEKRLRKSDHFLGYWYQKGDTYAEDATIQQVWSEMLQSWEGKELAYHVEVQQLWQHLNQYFYQGFEETMAVLGARFDLDQINYESEVYQAGKEIVLEQTKQRKFEQLPDGAIKANLEKFNLPDKILLRRDGTGIYMTFDIELTRRRVERKVDSLVWVVGVDQQLYFKQLFAIAELLGYGAVEKFYHFAYGMVRLPEGKMSSRKGLVIYADDLLEMAQDKAREIMQQVGVAKELPPEEFEQVVKAVGVGAVKWTMLAQDPVSEITFNIEESVSFTGFAGPYIQYTLARTHSIFKKAENSAIALAFDTEEDTYEYFDASLNKDERDVLVVLSKYFDIVEKAAAEFAPHHIAVYLHELAQRFNTFYAHCTIVSEHENETQSRLLLTKAVQLVLTEGLNLLGITPVERM